MQYRSIKKPATFGSVTLSDVEEAAKALGGSLPGKLSFFGRFPACELPKEKILLEANFEEVPVPRFSPRLLRSLRRHLGITQKELAVLTRVTVGAVQQWESGKFRPKEAKKSVMVALRRLGRRDVRKLLARMK